MVNSERSNILYFPKENPRGWHTAVSAKVREARLTATEDDFTGKAEILKAEQEKRWQEITGEYPNESSFTIIMPIHDERKAFTSAFASLVMSDIPPSVPVNILLITNACTDGTEGIVIDQLTKLGKMERKMIHKDLDDPHLSATYREVRDGSKIYKHISTQTAGKANALTIGTKLALAKGDSIAMCIDANNYLEPDAIARLYAQSVKAWKDKDSDTVMTTGYSAAEEITSPVSPYIGRMNTLKNPNKDFSIPAVNGQLFSWNTEWVKSVGYVPKVKVEDAALGILAEIQHKKVDFVPESTTWTYLDMTASGVFSMRERAAMGFKQMMELYPESRPILEKHVLMQTFPQRVSAAVEFLKEHPKKLPAKAASFLIWEAFHANVRRKLKKDPLNHSWKPLKTK